MYQGDEDIFRALKSGAATYLLKDTPSDELVRAVRDVHLGLSSLPANVAQRLATRPFDEGLTSRGMEVLRLLAAGMRNKEIAAALDISQETVQGHVKKILRTLEVNDRTAAVTVAIRRGIIRLD
jgi:two-component system NarL family response regulator